MLLIPFCMVAGCDKEKEEPEPEQTNAARKKLLSGTWRVTALTFTPAFDANEDGIATIDDEYGSLPCEQDDFITYLPDGTWKGNIGLVCDYQDDADDDFTGYWAISDSGNSYSDDDDPEENIKGEYENTILQLDEGIFKYQYLYGNNGEMDTVTVILTRQ